MAGSAEHNHASAVSWPSWLYGGEPIVLASFPHIPNRRNPVGMIHQHMGTHHVRDGTLRGHAVARATDEWILTTSTQTNTTFSTIPGDNHERQSSAPVHD